MKEEHVEIGFMDVPVDYINFNDSQKNMICDRIIDSFLHIIEKELYYAPEINRISFLHAVLDSSLDTNVENELYEVAAVIRDMKKRLNDA